MNYKQIIGTMIAVLSVLAVSTTQLTDIFGAGMAKNIASLANLLTAILGAVVAAYTSNRATVLDASNVPGVDNVSINRSAAQPLAALAMDPKVDNVSSLASDAGAVRQNAEGN